MEVLLIDRRLDCDTRDVLEYVFDVDHQRPVEPVARALALRREFEHPLSCRDAESGTVVSHSPLDEVRMQNRAHPLNVAVEPTLEVVARHLADQLPLGHQAHQTTEAVVDSLAVPGFGLPSLLLARSATGTGEKTAGLRERAEMTLERNGNLRREVDDAYAAWVLQPTLPLAGVEPYLAWFLCGVQRSGTWLLAGLLDSTGVAGRPHEWFSEAAEAANRRAWDVRSAEGYVDCVKRAGTTPNGVFACKLTWDAVERVGDLKAFAPDCRFVWLRRDPEAIGVSWAWAAQTGRYHAWDPPPRIEPRFVREDVDALVRLAREHDAGWSSWFSDRAIEPLELRFDEVVREPRAASTRVLGYLGLPDQPAVVRTDPSPPSDWQVRYRR
jgi:LPS sulfotransferase NodH